MIFAGFRLPHRLGLAGNTLAASQALVTLKGFFQDFLPICSYVVSASRCLFLQEAPHRESDHREGCAPDIEQPVSISRGTLGWITRAGPTATHWHSLLECWASPRRIWDAGKQEVLRLCACPPLFNRTRPGGLPARRPRKWISHAGSPNRERFMLHLARTAGLKRERCRAAGSIAVATTLTSWKRCDRTPPVRLQDRSAPETMQEPSERPKNRAAQSAARLLESSTLPPSALPESPATA